MKKVADIQNAAQGEHKLREINDEINDKIKEKERWEDRIRELGGPDYKKIAPSMFDAEGSVLPGSEGYRYFGAARDLPKVRELFQKEPAGPPKKSRAELYKKINYDYYGFRDNTADLLQKEAILEKRMRDKAVYFYKYKYHRYKNGKRSMEVTQPSVKN